MENPLGSRTRFMGDWGSANFTRICVWLATELYRRKGRAGLSTIYNSEVWMDSAACLLQGDVDVSVATPPSFMKLAYDGRKPFDAPAPELRALALLPHDDAVFCIARPELGARTIGDLAGMLDSVRLVTAPNDGMSYLGLLMEEVLEGHGLPSKKILAAGGTVDTSVFPNETVTLFRGRRANVLLNEAWMIPDLWAVLESEPVSYLGMDEQVIDSLVEAYGLSRRVIPAGHYPNQAEPISTIDFSGWLIATTANLPDQLAYDLTAILVEERARFERLYASIPVHMSPLAYPIDPLLMPLDTGVPLHDGAHRYYAERGLLPDSH